MQKLSSVIKTLEISGCIVVADAMNCRIETAKSILEANADYLYDKLRAKMNSVTKTEKGHGRIETRSAFTTNEVSWMPGGRQWPGLKCIGAIKIESCRNL